MYVHTDTWNGGESLIAWQRYHESDIGKITRDHDVCACACPCARPCACPCACACAYHERSDVGGIVMSVPLPSAEPSSSITARRAASAGSSSWNIFSESSWRRSRMRPSGSLCLVLIRWSSPAPLDASPPKRVSSPFLRTTSLTTCASRREVGVERGGVKRQERCGGRRVVCRLSSMMGAGAGGRGLQIEELVSDTFRQRYTLPSSLTINVSRFCTCRMHAQAQACEVVA